MNGYARFLVCSALVLAGRLPAFAAANSALSVTVDSKNGSYSISSSSVTGTVLRAEPAIHANGKWIMARDYPTRKTEHVAVNGDLGDATDWSVHYSGLKNAPDLLLRIRIYADRPFGELQLTARNTTAQPVRIESLRLIDAVGKQVIHLGGDAAADRVLSDSFSEDRPGMQIRDLNDAEKQVHRAVGSQLIYNRQTHQGWFIGALSSDKFLSVLRLHMAGEHTDTTREYEVDSTGTTELLKENSLQDSDEDDRVELSMPLTSGAELHSERMLFSVSDDYHNQLETYARLIRDIHHARVSAPTPLGWWSWTAYYFGLNQGTALTNSEWLAQHLKPLGYVYFHMDEGYQYARGEYATADARLFPSGIAPLEYKVIGQGLTPGVWTAPFEISERSWVFTHHPEWLIHNAKGTPIHIGKVADDKDHLYALDPTHPEAQAYLRKTYSTLVNEWGIRYIKMDFMEDSAIEGFYHVPGTTALEAQRIGIKTIREAVGDHVLLDKDGSELLNPVGLVDLGRISQDTGHTFSSSKDAAPGIAARYYMNRNYFVADPDAFSVSRQTVDDQNWHGGQQPLTLDEAKVSIALAAVSGGMFEIGDDLPTLGEDPDRVALVENADLIDIAHLGHASTPLDLMTYAAADLQPSLFLLRETPRQSIVTIFNWTESPQSHTLQRSEIGLNPQGKYTAADLLSPKEQAKPLGEALQVSQPARSVRMFKIIDTQQAATAPPVATTVPSAGKAGESLHYAAKGNSESQPLLRATWDFGDGTSVDGFTVDHAYTHSGNYTVHLRAVGIGGIAADQTLPVSITGAVTTKFMPEAGRRFEAATP